MAHDEHFLGRGSAALAAALALRCGGGPPPAAVVVTPVASAAPVASGTSTLSPPEAPKPPNDLWLWLHVEHPGNVAALLAGARDPYEVTYKDLGGWVSAMDPTAPFDVVVPWLTSSGHPIARFTTTSAARVRALLDTSRHVVDVAPGLVRLESRNGGGDLPYGQPPGMCQLPADGGAGPVTCGTEQGLRDAGPWLATAPTPDESPMGAARLVVQPPPATEVAKDPFASSLAGISRVSLVVDADGGNATATLEAHVKWSASLWPAATQSPFATVPPAFGRIPRAAARVFVSSGSGPLDELKGPLLVQAANVALGPDGARPTGLGRLLDRPWLAAQLIDVDEALPVVSALARATARPGAWKRALAAADALEMHDVSALTIDFARFDAALRSVVAAHSGPGFGARYALRTPSPALRLPRQSLLLDELDDAAGSRPARTRSMLVVGDGDVTWFFVGKDDGRLARLARRVLARPATTSPDLDAGGDVVARGTTSASLLRLGGLVGLSAWLMELRDPSSPVAAIEKAAAVERALSSPPAFVRSSVARDADGLSALHLTADAESVRALIGDLSASVQLMIQEVGDWAVITMGQMPMF